MEREGEKNEIGKDDNIVRDLPKAMQPWMTAKERQVERES